MDEEQIRDLRSRLAAIEASKAGGPPIPVWHEHDRYNYAEPEHRFRARLEDWGREGWAAAAALREKLDDCLATLRLIERVTRPDGVMANAAVNLLIRSGRWQAYVTHEGTTHGEVSHGGRHPTPECPACRAIAAVRGGRR